MVLNKKPKISNTSLCPFAKLLGRHGSDFLPVLKNPSAAGRRLEVCRPRATRRSPASTLVRSINNLIDATRYLTSVRPTLGNRVYLFGCCVGGYDEVPAGCVPMPLALGNRNVLR